MIGMGGRFEISLRVWCRRQAVLLVLFVMGSKEENEIEK